MNLIGVAAATWRVMVSLKHRFMPAVTHRLGCPLVVARETNIYWRNFSLGHQQCVLCRLSVSFSEVICSKTQQETLRACLLCPPYSH